MNEATPRLVIQSVEIEGFRAFNALRELDFKAPVVLVSGSNGVGKTSLADALNLGLNQPDVDPRVLRDQGERVIWRDRKNRHVTIEGTEQVGPENVPAKTPASIPLSAFASVFYQADPSVDLEEFAQRARIEAPPWIDDVRLRLEEAERAIREAVEGYRPHDVPSEKHEGEERWGKTKPIKELLDALPRDSAAVDLFDGVLIRNGNVGSHWRSRLAKKAGMADAKDHEALARAVEILRELRASQAPKTAPEAGAPFEWPIVPSADPPCRFLWGSDGTPEASDLDSSEGVWFVPVGDESAAALLGERAATLRAVALQQAEDLRRSTSEVQKLGADPFEERLAALAREAPSWLAAAEKLGIAVPPRTDELARSLSEHSAELASEAKVIGEKVELLVAQRRDTFNGLRELEARANDLDAAVSFGEHVAAQRTVTETIKKIVEGREAIRFSELRAEYEAVDGFGKSRATEADSDALARLIAAVESWRKFEIGASRWAEQRAQAHAHQAAARAAEPFLAAIKKMMPQGRQPGLLTPPPIAQEHLDTIADCANRMIAMTALGSTWELELAVKKPSTRLEIEPRFKSREAPDGRKLGYANLSTGQKTLASLSLALAFNLLTDRVKHDVLVFDDVGTALDLAQPQAFALILRALAYAPDGSPFRRQIVLASHHGDMTDRFVDLLAPPKPNERLLVHDFEGWSEAEGPTIATYEFRERATENGDDTAAAEIFEALVRKGVRWVEERY